MAANESIRWVQGYLSRHEGLTPKTQGASYSLNDLAERGFLKRDTVSAMLLDSGLRDFYFRVYWAEDYATSNEDLEDRIGNADGYIIFIHGWTGSNAIWEDLPGLAIGRERRLVALVVDHNGFGSTPFAQQMPNMEHCDPVAAMRAVERWFNLLNLRRQPGETRVKTVNFIGHSMGAAALFFAQETAWKLGEMTRLAIAPALLLHDELHRAFYTALGLGIGLVGRIRVLEVIDQAVKPAVLETLADGATQIVKDEHFRIYNTTPKSVTARTFAAMGMIREHPEPHQWEQMRVVLGHRDPLVGLGPMLNLLEELHFDVDQIRVVLGTHYLFSVGNDMKRLHEQNRQLILDDIQQLHKDALAKQKRG